MASVTAVQGDVTANQSVTQRYVNFKPAYVTILVMLVVYTGWRMFQQVFAWSAGLDSTDPEFDRVWMTLLKVNVGSLVLAWFVVWSYLWLTRDRHLGQLKPKEELKRYFRFIGWLLCYAVAVYAAGSFFGEQDASWHQTVVRDTSFTPSHIVLFYGTMPLYVLFGVGALLYAVTRLPKYSERISIPLVIAVAGPFLILPNLAYNEWGHAFWLMEELFIAPLHWGFVILGWALLAAGGVLVQLIQHLTEVFDKVNVEETA